MLSERRVEFFDEVLEDPIPLRPSLDQLVAGLSARQERRAAARHSEKVVRPAAFARDERPGRGHALNALKTIIKAADVCKTANQESQKQATRASEIARRAIAQLELANSKLEQSDRDLAEARDSLQKMEQGIVAQLHEMSGRNAHLQAELDSRDRDIESLRALLAEMKEELLSARQRADGLETALTEAQDDLQYVAEITCEALQVGVES